MGSELNEGVKIKMLVWAGDETLSSKYVRSLVVSEQAGPMSMVPTWALSVSYDGTRTLYNLDLVEAIVFEEKESCDE